MKYLLLSIIALVFCCKLNAQNTVRSIDSSINKTGAKKSRFGNIVIGTREDRAMFFYHKSNKKMFSIIVQVVHKINGRLADTMMTSTGYFFIEDKLVKIYPRRFIRGRKSKNEHIYFENNQLLADKSGMNYSPQQINSMIAKAYELLADGKIRVQQKFTNP
jgi:hypothetical protein